MSKIHEPHVSFSSVKKNQLNTGFELLEKVGSSATPLMDLRDHLTRKRIVSQTSLHCHRKQLISALLSDCYCDSCTVKYSVFSRLSTPSRASTLKRRCSHKQAFPDFEYSHVTSNMVNSKSDKSKTELPSSGESDGGSLQGLKAVLSQPEGVYKHTRSRTGVILPVDYK